MQEEYHHSQPQLAPSSPQFEEACRASAQKHAKRCIRLGLLFRGAEQKAYESWLQLNKWADAQEETA